MNLIMYPPREREGPLLPSCPAARFSTIYPCKWCIASITTDDSGE